MSVNAMILAGLGKRVERSTTVAALIMLIGGCATATQRAPTLLSYPGCYRVDVGPWQIDGAIVLDPPGNPPEIVELTRDRLADGEATGPRFRIRSLRDGTLGVEAGEWWMLDDGRRLIVRWGAFSHGVIAEVQRNYETENDRERMSGEARAWSDDLSPKWPRSVLTMTPVECDQVIP